eukprot:TRINITY_DN11675_c0_g1_i1.p1 TRINITY_DN11675_c0_g1~~TRINITY_DN11675_c0_g1_i1.p1  ORF type:complete len:523 (+),score=92.39 TRINITY_DN11675_c0_g1_i1:106-1674(+)
MASCSGLKLWCKDAIKRLDTVQTAEVDIPEGVSGFRKLLAFLGPGLLVAIAYVDPGNFTTDISAGAQFQYQLVWMMLLSTVIGFILQLMSAKLGIVTGHDLATACRISYPKPVSITLWLTTEVAVIAADIPEVIGTAMALKILFGLPLWAGVLITGIDTLLFLAINLFGIRMLELLIGILVGVISVCFVVEMFMAAPPGVEVLKGFIPKLDFSDTDQVYTAVSLLGAVVMPHNLFLHSALVRSRKIKNTDEAKTEAIRYNAIESGLSLGISFIINMAIIVVAGAKFFPNPDYHNAGLENAGELLTSVFGGRWAGILFGIALLASGQSSTMTGTYAGQFVMEGFLNWKIAVWKRNLITRSVAIVPSLVVALIFGDKGSDSLIVLSQVILAVQLPYCMIPMLKITSSKKRMINPTLQNSLPFTIAGWALGCLVMAANVFLISTTISQLDGLFVETKANVIFAFICLVALVYFGFTVYLVLFNVDNVLEHVPSAMEETEAVEKLDEEQPLVNSVSDPGTPISING